MHRLPWNSTTTSPSCVYCHERNAHLGRPYSDIRSGRRTSPSNRKDERLSRRALYSSKFEFVKKLCRKIGLRSNRLWTKAQGRMGPGKYLPRMRATHFLPPNIPSKTPLSVLGFGCSWAGLSVVSSAFFCPVRPPKIPPSAPRGLSRPGSKRSRCIRSSA